MTCKHYELSLKEPYFSLIKNGLKTFELVPKHGIFNTIKNNDIIIWTADNNEKVKKCKTLITDVKYYNTISDVITTEFSDLPSLLGIPLKPLVEDNLSKLFKQWYDSNNKNPAGMLMIYMKVID